MSKEVNVWLKDDLDGSQAAETVIFGLDGKTYEIDLNEKNAAAIRKSLEKYLQAARVYQDEVAPITRRRGRPAGSKNKPQPQRDWTPPAVRAWAASKDIELSSRGRIPGELVAQYLEETHQAS